MPDKLRKTLTLSLIYDHPKILLGMKKRGFGVGHWNGFGGKVSEDETVEDGAIREVKEEIGVTVLRLEKQGILEFEFENDPEIKEVHIFRIHEYAGKPSESEEMRPQWFFVDEIPFKEMWADDVYWMPLFLKGRKFKGRFLFDRPSDADRQAKILDQKLEVVRHI